MLFVDSNERIVHTLPVSVYAWGSCRIAAISLEMVILGEMEILGREHVQGPVFLGHSRDLVCLLFLSVFVYMLFVEIFAF